MYKILLIIGAAFISGNLFAQQIHDKIPAALNAEIDSKAFENWNKIPALNKWMQARNDEMDGITSNSTTANHVLFRWPMRASSNYDDIPNYHTVINYMDQSRGTNRFTHDFKCNYKTYEDHEGNDYSLYPFFWRMKNKESLYASAGASGIVIAVRDSIDNDDNCFSPGENTNSNYVALLHSDSSITGYVHIKKGSAKVSLGQFVQEGQLLALIGSSGRSSNPHLHFDLKFYRADNNVYEYIEPFYSAIDTCNKTNNDTWWKDQKTYVDPKLNRIMTHSGVPVLFGNINSTRNDDFCPETEDAKAKAKFNPGEKVVIGVALTHVNRYDSLNVRVYYPDGQWWSSAARSVPDYTNGFSVAFRDEIYMTFENTLPANAPTGTYTIVTDFNYRPYNDYFPFSPSPSATRINKTYQEYFTVGCITSQTLSGTSTLEKGYIVSNAINSTQDITGTSRYQSGNYIQLNPGFIAQAGATFKARIKDCNETD